MEYRHVPVMLDKILECLAPKRGGKYLDCTLGGAGYTLALAEAAGANGKVLAIDLDELAIKNAEREINLRDLKNIVLVRDNFKNLENIIETALAAGDLSGPAGRPALGTLFDGIVLDLGLSSAQLDDEARGFSFRGDRPLDMAFGPAVGRSTTDIINDYPFPDLARIFRELGEERRAGRIAKEICEVRRQKRIKTSGELVAIIEKVIPFRHGSRLHPATKIFQALRMETNSELDNLASVLPLAINWLVPGGRIVVVSFHSGEDRIVKRFFKEAAKLNHLRILTKRPLIPTELETGVNPRARSAKFRAAQKI